MAEIKKAKRYPTDLTDEEWSWIVTLLSPPSRTGRKRDVNLREFEHNPVHGPIRRRVAEGAPLVSSV